jgi:putative lumazine-binding protein
MGHDAAAAQDDEEQAVLATLSALLDAISDRDSGVLREILMPEGVSAHVRDGSVSHVRFADLPDRWTAGTVRAEERIGEPLVRVDENIAMVWVGYDVYVEGEPRHWGTNIISFCKLDGRWRISGIADNGRPGARPTAT